MNCLRCEQEVRQLHGILNTMEWWECDACGFEWDFDNYGVMGYTLDGDVWTDVPPGCLAVFREWAV